MPQNPPIPPNDDYFSRFYEQKDQNDRLKPFRAEDIEDARLALQKPLRPHQIPLYHACLQLFSPHVRGWGRTYAILTAQVDLALQYPDERIFVIDHYPSTRINGYTVRRELERIIRLLPESIASRFVIDASPTALSIVFRPK